MNRALVITHPYGEYDKGFLEERILKAISVFNGNTILITAENAGQPYGDYHAYDRVYEQDMGSIKNSGPGAIRPEDAANMLKAYSRIFLAGGYLEECLTNTYNSILGVCEKFGVSKDVELVSNLVFLQAKKSHKLYTLADRKDMILNDPDHRDYYLGRMQKSEYVKRGIKEMQL